MLSPSEQMDAFLSDRLDEYIAEISRLCAQPSISATGDGVPECADLVVDMLARRGLRVEKIQTPGHPVVVAHAQGLSERTLLLYNHYDVQPPEPLDLWVSPPFEPVIRDGALYARGTSDDKGEFVARLAAMDAVRAANDGALPCNLVFVVEGEEEIGSPYIAQFVRENKEMLRCHGAIWEIGEIDPDGRPVISLGYRGVLAVELTVEAMKIDAHSGSAHRLPSAAWRLLEALAAVRDIDGGVKIPGFYDSAHPPSDIDLQLLEALPTHEELQREVYGIREFAHGLQGSELNRAVYEPTCNIQGITTGYQGRGMKTVIPARASAKLDFRLIPDQDPDDIFDKLRKHLDDQGFEDVSLTRFGSMWPAKTREDDPLVHLTSRTAQEVYGRTALLKPLVGGSSPVYAFAGPLGGIPVVSAGIRYWDNRPHAPNEHIRIVDFLNGARHLARMIAHFGEI